MTRAVLLALLAACSSGETTSAEWYAAPAVDAGIDAPPCPTHFCNDSYVTCQYCLCPGEPCQHVAYPSGEVIAAGVCGPDLVCSAPCPSIDCAQENQ